MTTFILILLLAYLLGSIPFGKMVATRYGVDIQKKGSGNIGFANVMRVLGWKPAIFVLLGDTAKSYLPVSVALAQGLNPHQVELIGFLAIIGHIYPVWLNFKGGKGIATGLGVALAINPVLGASGVVIYCATIALLHKSGPSSVISAWSLPFLSLLLAPLYSLFFLVLAVLGTYTHRVNLRELLRNAR